MKLREVMWQYYVAYLSFYVMGLVERLFNKGLFELNIIFVILLFGFGNVFHMFISILLYRIEIQWKNKEV